MKTGMRATPELKVAYSYALLNTGTRFTWQGECTGKCRDDF